MTTLPDLDRAQSLARLPDAAAWQRLRAELEYAQFLADVTPDQPAWRACVQTALDVAAGALAEGGEPGATLTARIEGLLAPLAGAAKARTVYLAGHAHIDMNWMWSWPETVAVTLDTFRTMLDLMDEFPEFHFSQSQASVYAIVRDQDPELLARIAARVREQRWDVVASHWVEGDKNMAGGESLCRHLLYTRAFMHDLFGLAPEDVPVDWSPDTFGHAAGTPTYLVRGGVRYLYLHRPGLGRQPMPEAFWWTGPDGARVLVRNDQQRGYNAVPDPASVLGALRAMHASTGLDLAMLVYGVGDHGGGPTRRDLLLAREMGTWPIFPAVRCARARDFFEHLARRGASLPVLTGELNTEFAGCYTTQSQIKRDNRLAEARLADAETAATLDTLARGAAYPGARLAADWTRALFSHFHDILPGSGVADTRAFAHGQFQETMASTSTVETRALRGLAEWVDTARVAGAAPDAAPASPALFVAGGQGAGAGIGAAEGRLSLADRHGDSPLRPFVIFNRTAQAVTEVVEFTLWDREPAGAPVPFHGKTYETIDAAGRIRPVQVLARGNGWGHLNMTLAAPVTVPALGYTTVVFRETLAPLPAAAPGAWLLRHKHHCSYAMAERNAIGLENALLQATFDPQTGRLTRLFDKRAGREMVDATAGGIGFEYSVERPHPMSAWVIDNSGPVEWPKVKSVADRRDGPYSAAIEVVYEVQASTIRVLYALHQDDPRLHVQIEADWFQRGTPADGIPNLRFAIPTTLRAPVARYEIPFGAIERRTDPDQEVPALRWAMVCGTTDNGPAALTLLNDCKHGHALAGATLRLNLIRSAYEPDPLPDIGHHTIRLALLPTDDLSVADATRAAQAFEHPPQPIGARVHTGALAPEAGLIAVGGASIILSGLKMTEDGRRLLVRVYEGAGAAGTAAIRLHPALGRPAAAERVDLLERPEAGAAPRVQGDTVTVDVPAHGIASVAITMKRD